MNYRSYISYLVTDPMLFSDILEYDFYNVYSIGQSFDSMNLVRLVLGEFFNKSGLIWNTLIQVDRITVYSTVQNFTLCMDLFIRLYLKQNF